MLGFVLLPSLLFAFAARTQSAKLARAAGVLTVLGVVLNRFNVSLIAFNWNVPDRYVPSARRDRHLAHDRDARRPDVPLDRQPHAGASTSIPNGAAPTERGEERHHERKQPPQPATPRRPSSTCSRSRTSCSSSPSGASSTARPSRRPSRSAGSRSRTNVHLHAGHSWAQPVRRRRRGRPRRLRAQARRPARRRRVPRGRHGAAPGPEGLHGRGRRQGASTSSRRSTATSSR